MHNRNQNPLKRTNKENPESQKREKSYFDLDRTGDEEDDLAGKQKQETEEIVPILGSWYRLRRLL